MKKKTLKCPNSLDAGRLLNRYQFSLCKNIPFLFVDFDGMFDFSKNKLQIVLINSVSQSSVSRCLEQVTNALSEEHIFS